MCFLPEVFLRYKNNGVIEAAVSSAVPFHQLQYTDMTGTTHTMDVYFGDPTYSIYSYSPGIQLVKGTQVSAIEK